MKVKKSYLAALALPLVFAACSEEELVSNVPAVSLEDRETFDLVLNATKPAIEESITRLGINGDKFVWEAEKDVVGAALADGASYGVPADDIFLNYPFSADASGESSTFSGKSAVVYGTYFFHFPYVDHLKRGALSFDFPSNQKFVVPTKEDDATSLEQAVKGMKLVSPLYQFANGVSYEDAATTTHGVDFSNLYSVAKINIIPSNIKDGVKAKVQKVTLAAKGSKNFLSKATINASEIPVITAADKLPAGSAALKLDKENFYNMIVNQTIYNIDEENRAPIVLDVEGELVLENGKATEIYMLVPKGQYADGLTLQINTSEGRYEREIKAINIGIAKATADENDIDVLVDKIPAIQAEMNFKLDGTGNVILPYDFDITKNGDWTDAVTFLEDHAIAYINKTITFNLKNNIEIENLPVFDLTIEGNKKLTLKSDYTISTENADQFDAEDVTLVMAAGKTLNLNAPMTGFAAIENAGILNVNVEQTKNIVNNGTMNIADGADLSGTITNNNTLNIAGTVELSNEVISGTAQKGLVPAKPATIKIAAGANVTTAEITNNAGVITVEAEDKKATTWNITTGSIGVAGSVVVTANATINGILSNAGQITNNGVWAAGLTNTGTFNVESKSVSNNTAVISGGAVVIKDIDDFMAIAAAKAYKFEDARVTTEVSTYKAYNNAMKLAALNDVTLTTGAWTFAAAAPQDVTSKVLTQPVSGKSVTLSGVAMTFAADVTTAFDMTLKGANTFDVKAAQDGTKSIKKVLTNNLSMESGSSLTVDSYVNVNEKSDGITATATLKGNVSVKDGAKMYFKSVTNEAVLSINGNSNTFDAGVFGVYEASSFKNKNQVKALTSTVTAQGRTKVSGKVTQPINEGDAIFQGNATAWKDL